MEIRHGGRAALAGVVGRLIAGRRCLLVMPCSTGLGNRRRAMRLRKGVQFFCPLLGVGGRLSSPTAICTGNLAMAMVPQGYPACRIGSRGGFENGELSAIERPRKKQIRTWPAAAAGATRPFALGKRRGGAAAGEMRICARGFPEFHLRGRELR